jgi:hypothetical protein
MNAQINYRLRLLRTQYRGFKKKQRENGENYGRRIMNSIEIKVKLPLCLSRHTYDDIYVGENTFHALFISAVATMTICSYGM